MKISTKGRYALEAVLDLAVHSQTEVENLNNISERLKISKNYLEQLFSVLRKKELINSVRGAQGGYRLARSADKITAGEVIRAVEGPLSPVNCIEEGKCDDPCNDYSTCVTRLMWLRMMDEINKAADSVTISDLVDAYGKMKKKDIIEYFI
ncbi:MAG: Rrf2 family transcriptional regulator [Firmicutes bacterium HGW-Firmicutes-1]|jgi:Rrf2 family protein|nr:MAG: Rrf2 family transcriptional regulator [Firmicutes bacterium HGW-Firmicutes-1]